MYGYIPPQVPLGSPPKSNVEEVDRLLKDRHKWLGELKNQLQKAQERIKKFADQNRSERQFSVGDWVYLKLQPYRQVTVKRRLNQKLSPKFYGPFEIIAKFGKVAYELRLPEGTQIHPIFHVSQLKGRIGRGQAVTPGIPLEYPSSNSKDQPEGILGRRFIKRNNQAVVQILVKWENQDEDNASWEDYEAIRERFPQFILRDKDNFVRERVSVNSQLRLLAVEHVDQVKSAKEAVKNAGQQGQITAIHEEGLTSGPEHSGRELEVNDSFKSNSLTVGPDRGPLNIRDGVKETLGDKATDAREGKGDQCLAVVL